MTKKTDVIVKPLTVLGREMDKMAKEINASAREIKALTLAIDDKLEETFGKGSEFTIIVRAGGAPASGQITLSKKENIKLYNKAASYIAELFKERLEQEIETYKRLAREASK